MPMCCEWSLLQPSGAGGEGHRGPDNYGKYQSESKSLCTPECIEERERMIEERCQQDNTKVRLDEIDECAG